MADAPDQLEAEVTALRARVAELERERTELMVRANAVMAEAQERAYWLDRWNLDLNALMRRRGAAEVRGAMRAARAVVRALVGLRAALRRR